MFDRNEVAPKFSEQIAATREKILKQFQQQIESIDEDQLRPTDSSGKEPFVHFGSNPPQIAAIKKFINALYHAEQAIKKWENLDTSSYSGQVYAVKQAYDGVSHVYNCLALLNDVTPEIQTLVANNYSLLEPIISRAYGMIQEKGWESQFSNVEVMEGAQTIIQKGMPYLSDKESFDPLNSFFKDLGSLIEHVADYDNPTKDKVAQREALKKIAEQFELNPLTKNLSFQSIEESKAMNTFLSWLKTLKESNYDLNEETIKTYVDWANQSLSGMLLFIDRMEQSNYLKNGTLSDLIIPKLDKLANQINLHIELSHLDNLEKVKNSRDFTDLRIEQIHQAQQAIFTLKNQAESSKTASSQFFSILNEKYKGRNLADIQESDRQVLRVLYAQMQEGMAHANLELDAKIVGVLNQEGPETIPPQGYYSWGVNFVKNSEIDTLIKQEKYVDDFYQDQIRSEEYKFSVHEKARAKFDGNTEELTIEDRVQNRLKGFNQELTSLPQELTQEPLQPYKASHLKNFRGNFAYLQELGLSKKVHDLRKSVTTLSQNSLHETDKAFFKGSPPYPIKLNEPDYIGQIKSLENALYNLELVLDTFEHLERNQSYWQLTRSIIKLGQAAFQVKSNITALPPAIQRTLAPVLENINQVSSSLSDLNTKVDDARIKLSSVKQEQIPEVSKEIDSREKIGERIVQLVNDRKSAYEQMLQVEQKQAASAEFFKILELNSYKSFDQFSKADLITLRNNFAQIQEEISFINLDLANQFVQAINFLESEGEKKPISINITPTQLLKINSNLNSHLNKQHRACDIQIESANHQLEEQGMSALAFLSNAFVVQEQSEIKSDFEKNRAVIPSIPAGGLVPLPNLAQDISDARSNLLKLFQEKLSPVLAEQLRPNTDPREVPFTINVDTELPQILALKRVINSMYHAEQAARKWNKMQYNPNSLIDQARMITQGLLILSDVNNALSSLRDMGPEVQDLLKNNYEIIQPMIGGIQEWIGSNEWIQQLTGEETGKFATLGSLLGQSINAMRPSIESQSSSKELIDFLIKVPQFMNGVTKKLDGELSEAELLVSQKQQQSMAQFIDVYLQDQSSFTNYIKAGKGVFGLIQLYKQMYAEKDELYSKVAEKHQMFLDEHYPSIITFLTEVEAKNFLKPGTLTTPFAQQMEAYTQKLEYQIKSINEETLFKMPTDLETHQLEILKEVRTSQWEKINHLTSAKNASSVLFQHLEQIKDKKLNELSLEDLKVLRQQFAILQDSLSVVDFETSNLLVEQLNQLETIGPQSNTSYLTVSQLLETKNKLDIHLRRQTASTQLQLDVIHQAMKSLGSVAEHALSPQQIEKETNNIKKQQVLIPEPGHLKQTQATLEVTVKNYLQSIQEVKLSTRLHSLAEEFTRMSQSTLSDKLIQRLGDQSKEGLYTIDENDPLVVNQLKIVNNAFVKLELSVKILEGMRHDESILTQGIALLAIAEDAQQLTEEITKLSPDIQQQCQSVMAQVSNVKQYIASLQNNTKSILSTSTTEITADKSTADETTIYYQNISDKISKVATVLDNILSKIQSQYPQLPPEAPNPSVATEQSLSEKPTQNPMGLKYVIKQFSELLVKIKQTGQESNQVLTQNLISLKERAYEELFLLSQMEDDLYLNPGTLTSGALKNINELFQAASLELDTMQFEQKLKLTDEYHYIQILIQKSQDELARLERKTMENPSNREMALQRQIKEDKLEHWLRIQSNLPNEVQTKAGLVEHQFEVLIRQAASNSGIENPFIRKHFEDDLRKVFAKEKGRITALPDKAVIPELNNVVNQFSKENIAKYQLVSRSSNLFSKFHLSLSEDHKQTKEYIEKQIHYLNGEKKTGDEYSIDKRVDRVQRLTSDAEFKKNVYGVKEGLGFFKKLELLVEAFKKTINNNPKDEEKLSINKEYKNTYMRFKDTYKQLKMQTFVESVIKEAPHEEEKESHKSQQFKEELAKDKKAFEHQKETAQSIIEEHVKSKFSSEDDSQTPMASPAA